MHGKKTPRNPDLWKGKQTLSLKDIYDWVGPWLNEKIKRERRKGYTSKRGITYEEFIGIINSYLDRSFEYIIKSGRGYEFGHKFGECRVVKTQCVLYNPRKYYFKTDTDGKKVKCIEKYRSVVLGDGTVRFMIWKSGNKKKRYKIRLSGKWKKKIYESTVDYMDYTMDKNAAKKAAIIYARTHVRRKG